MIGRVTTLFPLWALAASTVALVAPQPFVAASGAIAPLLGVVMLGMGLTLRPGDFGRVVQRPAAVGLGVALQYSLMPFVGWGLGHLLGLPAELAAGVVLVGSCPGGTASNVICYLARGDVALSITLTTLSTLVAVVATPALTWLYVGQRIDVPVLGMLRSIATIVVLPVVAGVTANRLLGRRLERVEHVFPLLSVLAIVLIIAIVVALNRARLPALLGPVALAVALHNVLGLALGYGAARALHRSEAERRTLAIEVGMQNSGLGVALATVHLSATAALPGALFSIWHNLTGALVAARWSRSGAFRAPPSPEPRGKRGPFPRREGNE